jgi:hypothetical protein
MSFALGIGIGLPFRSSSASAIAISAAATLAGADSADAFAIDFTDDHFHATTGFYGSAWIGDTTTPANNYDSSPTTTAASLLTYTAPSLKMTRQNDGNLAFQAHNLYLNSASPANQSITVVSGATYAVTITGTVSVTASGAATGTWTAGTQEFTAATTTLTLGSTSGAGTVHVRRTPSVSAYLATAGAIRVALPLEWDADGDLIGMLQEDARTNLCLYSDDLTNAAWTKSNLTTAKTATGPDGVANSATTITATDANATALQAITSASALRVTSVFLKRRTGTGNIDLTQDNGSTWTTVTATSDWTRVNIAAVTSANPTVGIRVVTSGDAVDVALCQHETCAGNTLPRASSPIPTLGAAVTRAADNVWKNTSEFAHASNCSVFIEWMHPAVNFNFPCPFQLAQASNTVGNRMQFFGGGGGAITIRVGSVGGTGTGSINMVGTTTAGAVNHAAIRFGDGNYNGSLNGGSVAGTAGTMTPMPTVDRMYFSQAGAALINGHIRRMLLVPRLVTDGDLPTFGVPA